MLGALVLHIMEVDVDDLVLGAYLLQAHQHPRHVRETRTPSRAAWLATYLALRLRKFRSAHRDISS